MRFAAPPLLPWPKLRYRSCLELSAQLPAAAARQTSAATQPRMAPKAKSVAVEIERLAAERAANAEALKEARAALRYERQREQRQRKREDAQHPHITPGLWAVLMLLFYYSGYDSAAPAEYWELHRRKQRLPPLPAEALKEKVEAFFLDVPPADLIELADPEGTPQYFLGRPLQDSEAFARRLPGLRRFARGRAASFLAKLRVRAWVESANSTKGLAPRTALLVEQYNAHRAAIPTPLAPRQLEHPATDSYSRLFAHRWRRMLKGKVGKIRVQDYVSLQEKRDKAEGGDREVFFQSTGSEETLTLSALRPCPASPAPAEAAAAWQWYRSLVRVLPGTKRILHVNMDETSVAAFHGDCVGNIASWKKRGPQAEPIVWADRKKRRTAYTHCAFICDDTAIQPLLPQLILANESTLRGTELTALLQQCPPNVFVKRLKSSWINHEVLKTLLRVLNEVLRPFKETRHVVLFMDAHKSHFHPSIAEYCARTDLHLVILPARLTWLMQPCDTHLFARYKKFLKRRYHELANESEDGVVDTLALLCAVLFICSFSYPIAVQKAKYSWEQGAPGSCSGSGGPHVMSYRCAHMRYSYAYVCARTHA